MYMGTDVHVDSLVFAEVRVMKLVVRGMSVDLTADQIGHILRLGAGQLR